MGCRLSYNLSILTGLVFSAFSMYLLVNYLVNDKRASFIGGIVFGFSTFKSWQIVHPNIASTQFFPIYVLFFIKMLREPTHQRRYAALAGLSLAFTFLIDYYQAIFALFFTICYLGYYLLGRMNPGAAESGFLAGRRFSSRRELASLLLLLIIMGTVFAAVGSPLLYADATAINTGYYQTAGGQDIFYADIAGFFVPSSPLFSFHWVQQANRPIIHQGGSESFVYAGWVVILLVAFGTMRLTRRLSDFRFWLSFILLSFLLCLGLQPHFLGYTMPIPGPYALWAKIPLINNIRVPARFDLLVTFAAAVLVGYSLHHLLEWLTQRLPNIRPILLTSVLLVLLVPVMIIENFNLPLVTQDIPLSNPAIFNQIAAEPGDFTILSLPTNSYLAHYGTYRTMYDQTMHHKNILEAFISRAIPYLAAYYSSEEYISVLSSDPAGLHSPNGDVHKVLANPKAMAFYRRDAARLVYYLNIRYIVAYTDAMPLDSLRFLTETLPLVQVSASGGGADGGMVVYQVRADLIKPIAETSTLEIGSMDAALFRLLGWYPPETDQAGGFNFAWMETASGQLLTTVREPADYTVTMQMQPMIVGNRPQTLAIYANDETSPVATFVLPKYEWQQRSFTVTREHWLPGINKLRLEATYATTPGNGDGRTYSIALRSITFTLKK